jgi:hypothetical protein
VVYEQRSSEVLIRISGTVIATRIRKTAYETTHRPERSFENGKKRHLLPAHFFAAFFAPLGYPLLAPAF